MRPGIGATMELAPSLAQSLAGIEAPFRWLVGADDGASYQLTRWVFLRLLAVIYLIAFASLRVQIRGLVGAGGILPVGEMLARARRLGRRRWRALPTLFWLRADDAALTGACDAGMAISALLLAGVAPIPCLVALWALYLSLTVAGQEFLSFQWDVLLLEAGFLAIFLAPATLLPGLEREAAVSPLALALLWWLLFRLMFESGVVKLTSGDPTWRGLSALEVHYFTQPLPTPPAWYAHQLPRWFHRLSAVLMYAIELGLPFLIFGPRPGRLAACAGLVLLQLLILLTGNYNFFNLLSIALCLLLVDDAIWERALPATLLAGHVGPGGPVAPTSPWRLLPTLAVAAPFLLIGAAHLGRSLRPRWRAPHLLSVLERELAPFRSLSAYGLFRVMTVRRPEIIVEGSRDGERWQAYEFRFKPGAPERRPPWVQPHQPRLDWQMWFAALRSQGAVPWFQAFAERLLVGAPQVLALLAKDPSPEGPPRFLRARLYDYRFTDLAERRRSGAWWRRELLGAYSPVLTIRPPSEAP